MNLEVRLKDVLQQIKSDTHLLRKREVGFKNVELWQGYKGYLSIEHEVEGDSTKDLKESLKFCSEVLGKEEKS